MVVQKNHQLTKVYSGKQINTVICLRMEKTYMAKTPPDDFKVITPENPLLSKQTVTSEVILILYTNL